MAITSVAQLTAIGTARAQETAAPATPAIDFSTPRLSWYGSLEWDLGRATYDAEELQEIDDNLQVNQGRFVVAPLIHSDVSRTLAIEATGQLVAWVRERDNVYQINADDVYAKFGNLGRWDIQVGRFEAWRVYNKFPERDRDPRADVTTIESTGAFDLFTLEDLGALCNPPFSDIGGNYCADIYEVNNILLRETVGSVAFHTFPTRGLGIELHLKYGQVSQRNTLGGRLAAIYTPIDFLQLSAAYESRGERSSSKPVTVDLVTLERTECDDCNRLDRQGFGGGVKLQFPPLEVAGNLARNQTDFYRADGLLIPDSSPTTTSWGGYAQVDIGPITVGGAFNSTVSQAPNPAPNRQEHLQAAGYVYWPFFDNLSVKLVGTYAEGTNDPFLQRGQPDPPGATLPFTNKAIAGRLRLKYFFNSL